MKVAYTNMFPRLALTGQFGLESDVLSNFLESPYSLLNGAVLAPLFGWGKNRAALNAQKLLLKPKCIAMKDSAE